MFMGYVMGAPAAAVLTLHPILMLYLFRQGGISVVWLISLSAIFGLNYVTIDTVKTWLLIFLKLHLQSIMKFEMVMTLSFSDSRN